jgi:nitrogen fixation protein FixH
MSDTNASERKSWEFTGWHMLVVTLGFFVVVVGVLTVMAVIAYRTFPGEVSEHP